MTNKEKSKQIAEQSQILSDFPHDYYSVEYGAMKMAAWKDKQLLTLCQRCEAIIEEMDKTCVWLHIDNKHCWED